MKLHLPALLLLTLTPPALAQQGPAYTQPMTAGGGTLRPSQLWIDPTGQNDSDSDALAWEDFTLTRTTSITSIRFWGETAPSLGFQIDFYPQDPNTIACQPDLVAGPFRSEIQTTFTQTSVGASLYQFDLTLQSPLTLQANTRYFISVIGRTPIFGAYWNWAQSPNGTNGTFWWQRGLHMYFNLGDNRAVALASSAGWSVGDPFCFGNGSTTACPCNNPSVGSGRGCNNSAATGGAILSATGTASLAADTLSFFSSSQRPTGTSILLQGTTSSAGLTFGQGLRCTGGTLKRLYTKSAVSGGIAAPESSDTHVAARSAFLGDTILSNQHRYYSVYYRDPTVLGTCPATSTFNVTNAIDILWTP